MKAALPILICITSVLSAPAQLAVTVSPVKIAGQNAVVPLVLKNGLSEKIESTRATVFLLDEQGRRVTQGSRWVIGGSPDKPALAAGATNAFHFVITHDAHFTTTNLTATVIFTKLTLQGGKLADVTKDVRVEQTEK